MLPNALLRPKPKTRMKNSAIPVSSALMFSRMTSESTRLQHAADEIHQPGADQVAHAFHVVHDARDQRAGFVGVVIAHRQPADVLLHLAPQLRDQALPFFGEQLGERERGDALNQRGGEHAADQRVEQPDLVFADHRSTSQLMDPGMTRLQSRLMTMSTKPSASMPRRGRTSSFSSGSALRKCWEA